MANKLFIFNEYKLKEELSKLEKIEILKIEGILIDNEIKEIINKIAVKELHILNSKISFENLNINPTSLYISNSEINCLEYINNYINLKELYLNNIDNAQQNPINLNDIKILSNLEKISLNNTYIANEIHLIYLDNIKEVILLNTNVSDITTLINNKSLESLVLDQRLINKNKNILPNFKDNNIKILNEFADEVLI